RYHYSRMIKAPLSLERRGLSAIGGTKRFSTTYTPAHIKWKYKVYDIDKDKLTRKQKLKFKKNSRRF
ncbi:MAG TPA: hypothetical protein VEP90_21205, partial [Methylomirabilota bacterium]|nr:hypothetical protein [Methylomirabilota bacterium]